MFAGEGDTYLQLNQETTHRYPRYLMIEKKRFIKSENILVIKVLQYKELTAKKSLLSYHRKIFILINIFLIISIEKKKTENEYETLWICYYS